MRPPQLFIYIQLLIPQISENSFPNKNREPLGFSIFILIYNVINSFASIRAVTVPIADPKIPIISPAGINASS